MKTMLVFFLLLGNGQEKPLRTMHYQSEAEI